MYRYTTRIASTPLVSTAAGWKTGHGQDGAWTPSTDVFSVMFRSAWTIETVLFCIISIFLVWQMLNLQDDVDHVTQVTQRWKRKAMVKFMWFTIITCIWFTLRCFNASAKTRFLRWFTSWNSCFEHEYFLYIDDFGALYIALYSHLIFYRIDEF